MMPPASLAKEVSPPTTHTPPRHLSTHARTADVHLPTHHSSYPHTTPPSPLPTVPAPPPTTPTTATKTLIASQIAAAPLTAASASQPATAPLTAASASQPATAPLPAPFYQALPSPIHTPPTSTLQPTTPFFWAADRAFSIAETPTPPPTVTPPSAPPLSSSLQVHPPHTPPPPDPARPTPDPHTATSNTNTQSIASIPLHPPSSATTSPSLVSGSGRASTSHECLAPHPCDITQQQEPSRAEPPLAHHHHDESQQQVQSRAEIPRVPHHHHNSQQQAQSRAEALAPHHHDDSQQQAQSNAEALAPHHHDKSQQQVQFRAEIPCVPHHHHDLQQQAQSKAEALAPHHHHDHASITVQTRAQPHSRSMQQHRHTGLDSLDYYVGRAQQPEYCHGRLQRQRPPHTMPLLCGPPVTTSATKHTQRKSCDILNHPGACLDTLRSDAAGCHVTDSRSQISPDAAQDTGTGAVSESQLSLTDSVLLTLRHSVSEISVGDQI